MNARARHLTPEHSEPVAESTFAAVYRMSRSQLLVGWGVVGLMLIVVFLFGFYSGRKQGVELALTEQSVPRLRLPVESPKARAALSSAPIAPETNNIASPTKFDFTDSKPDSFALEPQDKSNTETIVLEPRQEIKTDPSAGFVTKAANEIIAKPEPKKEIAEVPDSSLAERVAKVELSPSLGTATKVENTIKVEAPAPKAEAIIKEVPSKNIPVATVKTVSTESKLTPPAPIKKAITTPTKTASIPTSGLFVQVGAPDSFSKAQAMVSKLKARGITAAIRDASVNHKLHYRVLVGPFSSRDSAQSAKNQVMKSGVALGEPFVKNF